MNAIDNSKRTLTQADVNAIADVLSKGEFVKNLAVKFAQIVGVKIQDEDIIDSETACRLLYNISPNTLKRYAAICRNCAPAGNIQGGTAANGYWNLNRSCNKAPSAKSGYTPKHQTDLCGKNTY